MTTNSCRLRRPQKGQRADPIPLAQSLRRHRTSSRALCVRVRYRNLPLARDVERIGLHQQACSDPKMLTSNNRQNVTDARQWAPPWARATFGGSATVAPGPVLPPPALCNTTVRKGDGGVGQAVRQLRLLVERATLVAKQRSSSANRLPSRQPISQISRSASAIMRAK